MVYTKHTIFGLLAMGYFNQINASIPIQPALVAPVVSTVVGILQSDREFYQLTQIIEAIYVEMMLMEIKDEEPPQQCAKVISELQDALRRAEMIGQEPAIIRRKRLVLARLLALAGNHIAIIEIQKLVQNPANESPNEIIGKITNILSKRSEAIAKLYQLIDDFELNKNIKYIMKVILELQQIQYRVKCILAPGAMIAATNEVVLIEGPKTDKNIYNNVQKLTRWTLRLQEIKQDLKSIEINNTSYQLAMISLTFQLIFLNSQIL